MELKNNLAIDFGTFSETLKQILLEDSTVFRSIYPGSTSKILVDVLAGYASMLMYRLQAAVSNTFLQTAFSEDSILAASEMLGVSIVGKQGSSVDLVLSRDPMERANFPELSIPLYTNFEINGLNFYNREVYTFPSGYQRIHMTLYQGEVHQKEFTTTGALNERFEFGSDFNADLNFVKVYIDGKEWKTDRETILDYAVNDTSGSETKQVVLLKTDSSGVSYIQFGNGLYGSIPMSGSVVTLYYASCDGLAGNFSGAGVVELKDNIFYEDEMLSVFSEDIGTASGGADRITPSMLKYISPRVFASNNRMVRRQDYEGLLMESSGYKDVKVWGEFEESKEKGYADYSMMNRVYYSALPNSFSTKTITMAVGDGENKVFQGYNISNTACLPGSILIEYKNYTLDSEGKEIEESEEFRDYSGLGYLFSNSESHTISSSVDPISIKADSVEGDHVVENVIMDIGDEQLIINSGLYYEASRQPSTASPLIIEFSMPDKFSVEGSDKSEDLMMAGIRILSAPFSAADDRAYPSKIMMIASREENVDKPLWAYMNHGAKSVNLFAQINAVTINFVDNNVDGKLKSEYKALASTGVEATITMNEEDVGSELLSSKTFPCKVRFENNEEYEYSSTLIVGEIKNKYYTFADLMHDPQWVVISDVNNTIDPGASTWGEWVSFKTVDGEEEIIDYKDGALSNKKIPYTFKHYRLIILGQHGTSSTQNLKINKIAFVPSNLASSVKYETGEVTVRFEKAPPEDVPILVTTIGEKISEYQYLLDYAFIKKMNHFTTEVEYRDPRIKRIDLSIKVVYDTDTDLPSLRNDVEVVLANMFNVRPGIIGDSVRLSSIYAAVMSVSGVKYCIINSPTSDIEADVNEILYLTTTDIQYQSSARLL